jgi:hypothetical protein
MITQEFIEAAIERNWKNNPDAPIFDTESELYRDISRQLDPINFGYYGEVGGVDEHYIHAHEPLDWIQGEPFILTDEDDAIALSSWDATYHHLKQNPWLDDIIFMEALYDILEEMKRLKNINQ